MCKQAFYVMSHVFVMCFASQISCDWITKEIVCDFICQLLPYAIVIHLISHENYHAFVSIFLKVSKRFEQAETRQEESLVLCALGAGHVENNTTIHIR